MTTPFAGKDGYDGRHWAYSTRQGKIKKDTLCKPTSEVFSTHLNQTLTLGKDTKQVLAHPVYTIEDETLVDAQTSAACPPGLYTMLGQQNLDAAFTAADSFIKELGAKAEFLVIQHQETGKQYAFFRRLV